MVPLSQLSAEKKWGKGERLRKEFQGFFGSEERNMPSLVEKFQGGKG